MKQMTDKELKPHLEALGLKLDEDNILQYLNEDYPYISYAGKISVSNIGIELIPEQPEITIENLGKFMTKFGEYPEADFSVLYEGSTCVSGLLMAKLNGFYMDSEANTWDKVVITDKRWHEIEEV